MIETVRKNWWVYVVVALFAVLLFLLLPRHEPWFDEAQFWLLARDIGIVELFGRFLRYEGTPALWILILMLPAKLGFPYITLNVISILFAIIGVYLVVMYSPFPIIIRILYPFTYFIFYQYTVVARSYILLILLLPLLAITYRERRRRVYTFTILLMLLGSVSLHGYLIALGLIAVEGIEVLRDWKKLNDKEKRAYLGSATMFGIFSAFTVLILWPPSDGNILSGFNFDIVNFLRVSARVIYEIMTGYRPPSILLFGVMLWWFWRTGRLLVFLATTLPILVLFAVTFYYLHHTGVIFLLLIFNLWLSFETSKALGWKNRPYLTVSTAILVIFSFHLYWAFSAFRYDFSERYSASRDVANYLKANQLDSQKISAVGNRTVAILPYFNRNIFANFNSGQKPCYWMWAKSYNLNVWSYRDTTAGAIHDKVKLAAMDNHALIVVSVIGDYAPASTPVPGYELTKLFSGRVYWRDKAVEQESFAIFTRVVDNTRAATELRNQ